MVQQYNKKRMRKLFISNKQAIPQILKICLLLAVVLLLEIPLIAEQTSPISAQEKSAIEPTTKIEKFVARRGQLIIKDFYKVGNIDDMFKDHLELTCLVFSVGSTMQSEKVFGVKFTRPGMVNYESEVNSFLDFDETNALSNSLNYMIKLSKDMATEDIEYREVIYETRGGMRVGFLQEGKKQTAFVEVGGLIRGKNVFLNIDDLSNLLTNINTAMNKLKSLGAK
jgi:hypothetical protein